MRRFAFLAALAFAPLARADELQLRDGTRLAGRLVSADADHVVFDSGGGPVSRPRSEVRGILLHGPAGKAGLPPGISLGESLRALRWFTVRRIAPFDPNESDSMSGVMLSGDGSKIVFSCRRGVYTINPDGTGLTQISEKDAEGYVSITADGQRVVWFEERRHPFIARSDGSEKMRLGGPIYTLWFRLTSHGNKLVIASSDPGGLHILATDGSQPRQILTTADVAKLAGGEAKSDHWWRPAGGISSDGSRIVFHYFQDAFACTGEGAGLRRLTQIDKGKDKLGRVKISGNGAKVAVYFDNYDLGVKSRLEVRDWEGGSPVTLGSDHLPRQALFEGISLSLSEDGGRAAIGPKLSLFDTSGQGGWLVADDLLAGEDVSPFYGIHMASFSTDFRRCAADLLIGRAQMVVIEFEPTSLAGLPVPGHLTVDPRMLAIDGSRKAVAAAQTTDPGWKYIGVAPFRQGFHVKAFGWDHLRLREADLPGAYATGKLQIDPSTRIEPGPLELRFFSFNKAGTAVVVDVEGLEVRKP